MAMSQSNHIPICPKCGYDQSGEIATWQDQCPMEGRCPECGLEFAWANVLDPARIELKWYIEHAKTKREMLRRTIPTLWYLLFPNRYWHRLGMEAPRSLKRYVLWIAMMTLTLHIVSSLAMFGAFYGHRITEIAYYRSWIANSAPAQQVAIREYIAETRTLDYWLPIIGESLLCPAFERQMVFQDMSSEAGSFGSVISGISVMWLILFCIFADTRKRTKLRLVHVARATVVAGLLPILFFEIGRILDAMVFVGEYWKPMSGMSTVIAPVIIVGGGIWLMIWIQWFWISAVWIGWKVKARWYEMVLVVLASFMGLVIGGGLIGLGTVISKGIDVLARWAGL
jgi:hypothetical protein